MKKIILAVTTGLIVALLALPASAQGGWLVVAWAGDAGSLPTGWQLCDGTNGTPDLADRFLVGAGSTYALADVGGTITNSLSHRHQVAAHTHAIGSVDLSHTHSVPSHNHTIGDSGALPHLHALRGHMHYISAVDLSHTHTIASSYDNSQWVAQWVIGTASWVGSNILLYSFSYAGGAPGNGINVARNYTNSSLTTHDHGGQTGIVAGTSSGIADGDINHNHGGTTGSWSGTSGAMSANSTHNHGGVTGSVSPMTDYQLSSVENRPPYYAVYYACAPADVWAASSITATAMLTDPLTTDYYTTTTGITYSRVRSVDTGTEITNYLLIAILCLVALQSLLWFITEAKRKWN